MVRLASNCLTYADTRIKVTDNIMRSKRSKKPKVKWWCSQCKTELANDYTGPCPNCGNLRKSSTAVENPIKRVLIKYLDKYAIRSFLQLLVHIVIALGLAALLYFLIGSKVIIQSNSFVTIMSSIAAASGALLAVSLAFATFMSRFMIDWRDRSIDKLQIQCEIFASQMKLSAQYFPDIPRVLAELYKLAIFYIPGQPIEQEIIDKAGDTFRNWANPQMIQSQKEGKTIDFGDANRYDSFEKHLFDAHMLCKDMTFCLSELRLSEKFGRSLFNHPPLLTGWAMVLVYSIIFAFIGGMGVLCTIFQLPILVIPIYLAIFAIIALVLDFRGIIGVIRQRETAYEMAMLGFTGTSPFIKPDK